MPNSLRSAVELVPEKLYAVGGMLPLDGRISWAPISTRGYQPINCYAIVEGANALIVDTGLPIHEQRILAQLDAIIPEGAHVDVYLTRAEMDCVGNLGAISQRFDLGTIYTGGRYNPFDAFDQLGSVTEGRIEAKSIVRILPGESIRITQSRTIDVIMPPFKMLASHWAYDATTKTMFTSDLYAHQALASPDYDPVLAPEMDDADLASVCAFVESRYWWIHQIAVPEIVVNLRRIFDDKARQIERIAPTRGCILEDGSMIRRHTGFLEELVQPVQTAEAVAS
jgi:hypothetical protein